MSYIHRENPTISDVILAMLSSGHSTRTFHRILNERALARKSPASISTTLNRLKKKNLVSNTKGEWQLTREGKAYSTLHDKFNFIASPFEKGASEKCIVSFDIPQTHRRERDWLRSQLKLFGYRMLQQSLWLGPGPLPKEFKERLSELNIKNGVRIFIIS